jgi:hypothetical protein
MPPKSRTLLLAVIAFATCSKIALAVFTYGTNDASMWEASAKLVREDSGRYIYEHPLEVFKPDGTFSYSVPWNHPPFMILVLSGLNDLSDATGMPVRSLLRILDTVADVATLALTAAILRSMYGTVPLLPMVLIAIAPSTIFISGFHANTDPIMIFFLVLCVYLIQVRQQPMLGVVSFAFASGIKVVPIFLVPALLLYFRTWLQRVQAILILAVFWVVTSGPWLLESSESMIRTILGYHSFQGHWGIGLMLRVVPVLGSSLALSFGAAGPYLLLLLLTAIAWWSNRASHPVPLFYQFGISLFAFFFVTAGFGIQYLAWLTPWAAALPWEIAAAYFAASGTFCAAVYTYWSQGLPWYYANSAPLAASWRGATHLLGLATWITIGVSLVAYYRLLFNRPPRPKAAESR